MALAGYQLCFHKQGQDGSAKCDLVIAEQQTSFGALYQLRAQDRPILDQIEGGYEATSARLDIAGKRYQAFTYLALPANINAQLIPFDWYLQLVHHGAEYLNFPESVRKGLIAREQCQDRNQQRGFDQQQLLNQIKQFNQRQEPDSLASGHLLGRFGE